MYGSRASPKSSIRATASGRGMLTLLCGFAATEREVIPEASQPGARRYRQRVDRSFETINVKLARSHTAKTGSTAARCGD